MKVYSVIALDDDGGQVASIWTYFTDAEDECERLTNAASYPHHLFFVDEFELDSTNNW